MVARKRKQSRKHTQSRGRVRREQLLDSAFELLETQRLDELSLAHVADAAGIPIGSAYHFYPDIGSLFQALAKRFGEEILPIYTDTPFVVGENDNWECIIDESIDRIRRFYDENPGYGQLIVGGMTPPSVKLSDRTNDYVIAETVIRIIDQHFVFPDFPRAKEIFFHAVEICDLLFTLSMIQENRITNENCLDAKRATKAFLRVYLPRELPRRTEPQIR